MASEAMASEAIALQPLRRPEGVEGRVAGTECVAASPRNPYGKKSSVQT